MRLNICLSSRGAVQMTPVINQDVVVKALIGGKA
jgi:hypothetical protein